jgi:hypothetical protein
VSAGVKRVVAAPALIEPGFLERDDSPWRRAWRVFEDEKPYASPMLPGAVGDRAW